MMDYLFYILVILGAFFILYWIFKKPIWIILALVLLLPFHAFLVTSLTYFANLNSFQSSILAFWKEFILLGFIFKIIYQSISQGKLPFKIIWFDWLILILFFLALSINYIKNIPCLITAYGLRYDFLLFATYFVFRSLNLNDEQFLKILKGFLWSGGVVILFGILQKFLPDNFLINFGYAGVTDWNPANNLPLPAYHYIHETHTQRLQSFFSGPNSLGSYLVILWGLGIFILARTKLKKNLWFLIGFLVLILILGFFTYSRSAWLAILVLSILFILSLFKNLQTKLIIFILIIGLGFSSFYLLKNTNLSQNFLRTNSSMSGHLIRSAASVYLIKNHPEGLGVGTAGPSSLNFEKSYTQVPAEAYSEIADYLKKIGIESNPESYPFVLSGPIIPENWFLQIGVEMGILGLSLFLTIIFGIFYALYWLYKKIKNHFHQDFVLAVLFIGIALFVHSLFLHTWSDAPTTILFGMLLGLVFSMNKNIHKNFKTQNHKIQTNYNV